MAQITELEKIRKQHKRKSMIKRLFWLFVVCAVVLGTFLVADGLGTLDIRTTFSDLTAGLGSGPGYPVDIPDLQISEMSAMYSNMLLVSDAYVYTYDRKGNQLMSAQHGFTNPTAKTSASKVLVYDRGGKRLRIQSKSRLIETKEFEYLIYDADIAQNGNFAVVTGSGQYLAQVTVFNSKNDEIFKWFSADKLVVDVSLSDKKDMMAVACADVQDGRFRTTVYLFQFNLSEAVAVYEISGDMPYAVEFDNDHLVKVITDKRIAVLDNHLKLKGETLFDEEKLNLFDCGVSGRAVAVLGDLSENKFYRVAVFDQEAKVSGEFVLEQPILDIAAAQTGIYILTDGLIAQYDYKGTRIAEIEIEQADMLCVMVGEVYYKTDYAIERAQFTKTDPKTSIPEEEKTPESSGNSISETESGTIGETASEEPSEESASQTTPKPEEKPENSEQEMLPLPESAAGS